MDGVIFDFDLDDTVNYVEDSKDGSTDENTISDDNSIDNKEDDDNDEKPIINVTTPLDLDTGITKEDNKEPNIKDDTKSDYNKAGLFIYNELKQLGWADEVKEGDSITNEFIESQITKLPQKAFLEAVGELHGDGQELLKYAYNLGSGSTREKLKTYFDSFISPELQTFDFEKEEDAIRYLKTNKIYRKVIKSDDRFNDEISDLKDNNELLKTAKDLYDSDKASRDAAKEKADKLANDNKVAREADKIEFSKNIKLELEALGLSEEMTNSTINILKRENSIAINNKIAKSPKAMVELAHILTYFDSDKGDFSKLFNILKGKKDSVKTKTLERDIIKDSFSNRIKGIYGDAGAKTNDDTNEIIQVKTI